MEGVNELVRLSGLVDRIMELDEVGLADKENLTRFMEETDTEDFIDKMKNPNTSRKNTGDVKLFTNYLRSVGEMRRIENILPEELNSYLARFSLNVRKQDRTEYEPDTLKTYQSSLSRYLGEKRYGVNILTDLRFKHSRDVLSAKRKELKCLGKGNKQRQADVLTNEEVSLLYSKRQLGTGSPTSLINTMWWNNTVHFGLRSRQEHISMRWGDVELMVTSTGEEYLQYSERATKTRTGVTSATRPFPPKMFALPGDSRCPVHAYKEYARRRPTELNADPASAFYIAINYNRVNDDSPWYSKQNMGKNKIGNLMKEMCRKAGIQGRKINHSARKTTVTTLLHSGVPPTQIIQVTCHKNVNSINHYSSASLQQQRDMSKVMSEMSRKSNKVWDDDDEDDLLVQASQEAENSNTHQINESVTEGDINGQHVRAPVDISVPITDKPLLIDLPVQIQTSSLSSTSQSSANNYLLTGANISGPVTINVYNTGELPKQRTAAVVDAVNDAITNE